MFTKPGGLWVKTGPELLCESVMSKGCWEFSGSGQEPREGELFSRTPSRKQVDLDPERNVLGFAPAPSQALRAQRPISVLLHTSLYHPQDTHRAGLKEKG